MMQNYSRYQIIIDIIYAAKSSLAESSDIIIYSLRYITAGPQHPTAMSPFGL
jgi:hypothetical protein